MQSTSTIRVHLGFIPFILCGNVIETFVILRDASRRAETGVPEVSPPLDDVPAKQPAG